MFRVLGLWCFGVLGFRALVLWGFRVWGCWCFGGLKLIALELGTWFGVYGYRLCGTAYIEGLGVFKVLGGQGLRV